MFQNKYRTGWLPCEYSTHCIYNVADDKHALSCAYRYRPIVDGDEDEQLTLPDVKASGVLSWNHHRENPEARLDSDSQHL